MNEKVISVVVPAYNEADNLVELHERLSNVFKNELSNYKYEIIFVDDGSSDATEGVLGRMAKKDDSVKVISLSRNFGKEVALTAGLRAAAGDAAIMIDSDLQQPPELVPEFIAKWEAGAEVVIGVRKKVARQNILRRLGGVAFYTIINLISETPVVRQGTDFRLLDRTVLDAFNELKEHNRMTRALIDWLGFKREFVYFNEIHRNGNPTYSTVKLAKLALTSFASHSLFPLKLAGYLGLTLLAFSGGTGFFMIVWKLLGHPYNIYFSNTLEIGVLNTFLISIVLMSLGIIALYLGNVHEDSAGRPLYVIRKRTNFAVPSPVQKIEKARTIKNQEKL